MFQVFKNKWQFILFLLITLFYPGEVQAATVPIPIGNGVTVITQMDHHIQNSYRSDPGNPSLPWPSSRTSTSSGNTAHASITATPGEAGIAEAQVGLNIGYDPSPYTWDEMKNFDLLVTLDFTYQLQANWTPLTGSSNAHLWIHFSPSWHDNPDNIGYEVGQSGTTGETKTITFLTTPEALQAAHFHIITQAHSSDEFEAVNSSQATVTVNSITFRPFMEFTFGVSGDEDIEFIWSPAPLPNPIGAYEVWRSPIQDIPGAIKLDTLPASATGYTDFNVVGNPNFNYTYFIRAVDGSANILVDSQMIGVFNYQIAPGG